MSSAVSARLGRVAKRKRDVPPLWESSLGIVISNLSTLHTDDFVKMVLADGKLRARFTDELLRRAKHLPELGDSDLVEIVLLPVTIEMENPCQGHYADHVLKYCTVGRLPHWLKGALKTQFKARVRGTAKFGCGADGNVTQDGRLEFELYEDEFETFEPLIDAYITLLQKTIDDESIPGADEFFSEDEVDVSEAAPGVMPDTVLWDAWDLRVNESEDRIREEMTERIGELFVLCGHNEDVMTPDIQELNRATKEAGDATVSTVWVRKPRVRLVLHPE